MIRWLSLHCGQIVLALAGLGAVTAYGLHLQASGRGLDAVDIAFGAAFLGFVALALRNGGMRRRLTANERRFHDIATASGDWVWETGPDLRFTYLSDNFPVVTGQDPAVVIGRDRADLRGGQEMPDAWRSYVDDVANRRPFRDLVYPVQLPSREKRFIKTSGVPVFDRRRRFRGYRGVSSDVTALVNAEHKSRALEAELVRAQRLETLGAFAGGVAHDVNNALSPILTVTRSLMRRLADRPKESADLGLAYEAASRCRDLVSELLTLVRRDGEADTAIDLKGPVADAIGMLRRSIPANIRFTAEIEAGPMPTVSAPVKIIQIVVNLVTNAVQAIGRRDGTVRLSVTAAPGGQGFRIEVADSGPGMDAELQARIFDPFFTTKPTPIGSGLGLTAVHSLARGLGGSVAVKSRPGEGACFTVTLPRASAAVIDATMAVTSS